MGECMNFPEAPLEFLKLYEFKDKEEIYTNGSMLIPTFRVEQMIEHYFNSTSTADVQEVRHGKWVLIDECSNEGVYCSSCHKKVYRVQYANQKVKSNYCPNCGAKMDKKDEDRLYG